MTYPLPSVGEHVTERPHVMAIGDFDGLHLGHRDVINHAKQLSEQLHVASAIMTFNPHPREVLGHTQYARYLAPFNEKMRLFEQMGIDYCFVVSFDLPFSNVSPEHFVEHMIHKLNINAVVVGFDFTFGHQGSGTVETLKKLCGDALKIEVVKPYHLDGQKVSSTLIREQLYLGRIDRVTYYLGRYYAISGIVVSGQGRGRTIGFPTANLELDMPFVIPRHGVYAVKVTVQDRTYNGVMNIGVKPTFSDDEINPTLEVHIMDFAEQIYGEEVKVQFVSFLRDEQKFASVDLLIEQIAQDAERASAILAGES